VEPKVKRRKEMKRMKRRYFSIPSFPPLGYRYPPEIEVGERVAELVRECKALASGETFFAQGLTIIDHRSRLAVAVTGEGECELAFIKGRYEYERLTSQPRQLIGWWAKRLGIYQPLLHQAIADAQVGIPILAHLDGDVERLDVLLTKEDIQEVKGVL